MDISIVILSYNTKGWLRRCMDAALRHQDGIACEVIVVDNASTDGSESMVRQEFPDVTVIQTGQNLGYAGGNNVGIRRATGEFVLLLNSDAILSDSALQGMRDHFRSHAKAGIVGPRLTHEDGSLHLSCRHFPTLGRHVAWSVGLHRFLPVKWAREWDWMTDFAHDRPRKVDMLSGACWMLRRDMLSEIGMLNDNLFLYGEEFDLCSRAARAGWQTWFVPVNPVVHAGGKSSAGQGSSGVITSYHRYRSGYLTMLWHRGRTQAMLAAMLDRVMLRSRLWKNLLFHRGRADRSHALHEALHMSRLAMNEMRSWSNGTSRER